MMTKGDWIDDWLAKNSVRVGETEAEFEARAEHAWRTHNEDPGADVLGGGDDHGLYFTDDHGGAVSDFDSSGVEGLEEQERRDEEELGKMRPIGRTVGPASTRSAESYRVQRNDILRSAKDFLTRPDSTGADHRRIIVKEILDGFGCASMREVPDHRLDSFGSVMSAAIAKYDDSLSARARNVLPEKGDEPAPVVPLTQTVIVESPYAGDVEKNVDYARRALADCLARGEAPFASHLLYTQLGVLDDSDVEERKRGIEAGFMIGAEISKAVFYLDNGMSPGMGAALVRFARAGKTLEFRFLEK